MAKRIKELSKAFLEKLGGDPTSVLSLPKEEAKKISKPKVIRMSHRHDM